MNPAYAMSAPDLPDAGTLRTLLAREVAQSQSSEAILPHLLADTDDSLHTEALVAQMRGLLMYLGEAVLGILAGATGERTCEAFMARFHDPFVAGLMRCRPVVAHVHELSLEASLVRRLSDRLALDSALSPLLQDLIGDDSAPIASAAMAVLAAQTRADRTMRRLELSPSELPLEALEAVIATAWQELDDVSEEAFHRAQQKLLGGFDESATRLSLFERLYALTADRGADWLQVERAGPALFLTGLAQSTRQSRYDIAKACTIRSQARLALSLRAAGFRAEPIERQCELIALDNSPIGRLDDIGTREAEQMLQDVVEGRTQ